MLHPILTAAQMRTCDTYTIREIGVPSQSLMERAGRAVARYLLDRRDLFPVGEVLVLCGGGNNGGDGLAAARFLCDGSMGETRAVTVCYAGVLTSEGMPDPAYMSEECRRQYLLVAEEGIPVIIPEEILPLLSCTTAVIDAVFGIGLACEVSDRYVTLFDTVKQHRIPVLAVDIPSGLCADSGRELPMALPAAATVTMQALKPCHILFPGADLCGRVTVCDLGIKTDIVQVPLCLTDETLIRRAMPARQRRSHKGSYGAVLVLCGSIGMSGAACLAAAGAAHSGAGIVRVCTPEENRLVLQAYLPEAIVTTYNGHTPDLHALENVMSHHYCAAVIGCGLGTDLTATEVLRVVLNTLPYDCPMVLDADGLNCLAKDDSLWQTRRLASPKGQVVITPHPTEMARLCGRSVQDILLDPIATARDYAAAHGVIVVLKDAHTVIASPDGETFINTAGNAGMAKGGSGDVLAGILGGLLAQRGAGESTLSFSAIVAAGVTLHAMAGDAAAALYGEYAMTPSHIIAHIPTVTKTFSDSRTKIDYLFKEE